MRVAESLWADMAKDGGQTRPPAPAVQALSLLFVMVPWSYPQLLSP